MNTTKHYSHLTLGGMAWRNLYARWGRTLLTLLGIALGVAAVLATDITNRNVANTLDGLFKRTLGSAELKVFPLPNESTVKESALDIVRHLPGVRLGGALGEIHEYGANQQALEECRDIYQSLGYRRGVATATQNMGLVAQRMGDYARARALFYDALRIRHDLGLQRGYAYSFEFIARIDEIEESYERAVQLLAAADTLRVRIGAPLDQATQKENVDALTRARTQLGDVAFELAWAKGATLTTEQAIALALS